MDTRTILPSAASQPDAGVQAVLEQRNADLRRIAAELKQELFGIDGVIDQVMDALRAWYVLPQAIRRPVIVCLWGLTGTGKTQLVRSLARKLGLYDRFVEVQMDGFSHGSGYRSSTISGMLADSGIEEGEPGILVLDEFQRYRTVDREGNDVKIERYQDVWSLLSDGRLPPSLSFMRDLENTLASSCYDSERTEKKKGREKQQKYRLTAWEAYEIKQNLKLREPLMEVMTWGADKVHELLLDLQNRQDAWETDYSRLLIFVCGNLDEMYSAMARRVEDCDTDADIFHALTGKLSLIDVKKALNRRFKPEQIARLGNLHVIFPSLSRATYQRLIASVCAQYEQELLESTGLQFVIGECVREQIYANAVFPAQGTRPLFSSAHAILGAPLIDAAVWALQHGAASGDVVHIRLDAGRRRLCAQTHSHSTTLALKLELNEVRQRASADFRALLAVHEAGHGLLYALLFGQTPQEVKINVASFEGGYNSYTSRKAWSRRNCLDLICVGLAGRAAEVMVFGADACTSGAEEDYKQATAEAAQFVRHYGFAERLSRSDVTTDMDDNVNTDVAPTNAAIEQILVEQNARADALLREHAAQLMQIVQELMQHGQIEPQRMSELLNVPVPIAEEVQLEPYAQKLADWARQVHAKKPGEPGAAVTGALV